MGEKWGNYTELPYEPNPMIKREYVKEILDSFPEELAIDWNTLRVIENNDLPDRWTIGIKFATK